jgi:hypothetical protein
MSGVQTGTTTTSNELVRQTTFAGNNALELVSNIQTTMTAPLGTTVSATNKAYTSAASASGITQYGNVTTATLSGIAATTTITFNPAWNDQRWTLGVNQSTNVNITAESVIQVLGFPQPAVTTTTTQTVKFLGFETVTVPAGTFVDACKLETKTTAGASTTTVTEWYTASGQGVPVKFTADDGAGSVVTQVLMPGGTVNGAPIN